MFFRLVTFFTFLVTCGNAVTMCPVFRDGYCVIDIANPCLGKPENDHKVVLIDKGGKILKDNLQRWAIGQNMAHLMSPKPKVESDKETKPKNTKKENIGVYGVGKKRGLRDFDTKRVITPPKWDKAKWNRSARTASVRKGGLWQLLDAEGNALTGMKWKSIEVDYYQPELSRVEDENGWGVMNAKTGEILSKPQFKIVYRFSRGKEPSTVVVKHDGNGILIDAKGQELLQLPELEFEKVAAEGLGWPLQLMNRVISYPKESGWGVIDQSGKEVLPFIYDFIGARGQGGGMINEGVIKVDKDGKSGFVAPGGKIISKPKWDTAGFFSEDLAYVSHGDRWGFIDKKGKIVIGPFKMGEAARE